MENQKRWNTFVHFLYIYLINVDIVILLALVVWYL
jgi:hypothetical protein